MKNDPEIGVQIGEILLPNDTVDPGKWAVIACDQFTSQPEYWQKVREIVGDSPSTLHLILPEVFLGTPEERERVESTQSAMRAYLEKGLLVPHEGLIYVERTVTGADGKQRTRHGLMMALDLEKYDFNKGSQSLIRATEGTILDRLPPRMRIREGAPLELPHILVLIDDPERTVIEPLANAQPGALKQAYDTGLMLGSGHLRGALVADTALQEGVLQALHALADPQRFRAHYGVGEDQDVLLFAMGDGNHSLATAKAIWEKIKPQVGMDHPARYALVEVENVHDEGLAFEPIHRVLFELQQDWQSALEQTYGRQMRYQPSDSPEAMIKAVKNQTGPEQAFGVVSQEGAGVVYITNPASSLPVGTLQGFLDGWVKAGGAKHIDYVHGDDVVVELGSRPGNLGFYLPAMDKNELFKTVILDGSLPRKTFSMGEAHEKRFYMEARRIAPDGVKG
jgi:hypothetical protein